MSSNPIKRDFSKNQITPIACSPSPAPTIKKENPDNPSRAILNELRDLFEKNKKNKDEQ